MYNSRQIALFARLPSSASQRQRDCMDEKIEMLIKINANRERIATTHETHTVPAHSARCRTWIHRHDKFGLHKKQQFQNEFDFMGTHFGGQQEDAPDRQSERERKGKVVHQHSLHVDSSDPLEQSEFPSHTHDMGMHSPSELLHVNSSGVQTCFPVRERARHTM